MWITWSALVFLLTMTYVIRRLYGHRWKGIFPAHSGVSEPEISSRQLVIPYFPLSAQLLHADIGISGIAGVRFSIKQVTVWDHIASVLRLSPQVLLSEKSTNQDYLLLSDAPPLVKAIRNSLPIEDALNQLRKTCHQAGFYLQSAHINPHRLWIRLKPYNGSNRINTAVTPIVDDLNALREALVEAVEPLSASERRDRMVFIASSLKGISYTFGLLLLPTFLFWFQLDFITLNNINLNAVNLPVTNMVTLALVVAAMILLHGSTRRHRALPVIILIGWSAAHLNLAMLSEAYNHDPTAAGSPVAFQITDISSTTNNQGSTQFSLILNHELFPNDTLRLDVPQRFYQLEIAGQQAETISLTVYEGRLGAPWIWREQGDGFTLKKAL